MAFRRGISCGGVVRLLLYSLIAIVGMEATAQDPPIRSGCEIDYPPFCIVHEDGRADGFSVELLREALSKMGRDVTFRTGPWADVRGWLERGEIDALPMVGRTPEREPLFDFTVPYLTMHGAIVVRRDTADVRTLTDLRGRTVAVMDGDNAEEFLRREERPFEIVTPPTFADALRLLAEGGCDAVVIQRLVAVRLIDELNLASELDVIDQPIRGFSQDFCFAVTEGNHPLLAILNEGLAVAMADGTHRRLYAKWFAHLELPRDRAVVIGGDANYPPFEYLDENGRPAGYNVDLIRAVAQAAGLTIEIRLGPWAEMLQALEDGDIDAMQGMFYSTERDERFDFSQAHTVNHCVAVVRKGEGPPPAAVEDLVGKRIVVQDGDIMHAFATEHGLDDALRTVNAQEDALRELAAGNYDSALVSRLTALYWIDQYGWRDLEVGRTPLLSPEYCFAVPNGSRALLAELSEGLAVIEQTGEYQRIYEKWMGVYDPDFAARRSLKYVGIIGGLLTLIVILILLWSWSLRRQVRLRTDQLRESTEFQRAMVSSSPVALYSVSLDGDVLTWNESAERVFGWTAEEVVGKPLPIVAEKQRDEFDALRREVVEGRSFLNREVVRQRRDGSSIDLSLSVAPLRDAQGKTAAIMAAAEEITARKRAEVRTEKLLLQQGAINRFALALGALLDLRRICHVLADEVERLQGTNTLILSQFDKRTSAFTPLYVMMEGTEMDVTGLPAVPLAPEGEGMQSQVLRTGEPLYVPNWAAQEDQMRTKYAINAEKIVTSQMPGKSDRTSSTQSAVFLPLMIAGIPVGVMQVQSRRLDDFDEDDIALLEGMASVVAVAIQRAELHAQVRAAFDGVVHALAASTEMRDPYTAGHQRRVTELACAIAEELGLNSERREVLRVAGLLHDIGKMSVPAEILSKPSGLSSGEMELLKGHARAGYVLLKGTALPQAVADAVLHHHERMDGSGYPDGLSGDATLLEARILAVADVVEAMASHRPYRAARTLEEAIREIETGAGTLYDSDVADACVRLFREGRFRFSDEPGGQDSM